MSPQTGLWLMPDQVPDSADRYIASYVAACQQATAREPQHPAGAWLLAQFTYRWATGIFRDEDLVPGPGHLRPMIELIGQDDDADEDDDAGDGYGPMTVGRSDYDDPDRWWL